MLPMASIPFEFRGTGELLWLNIESLEAKGTISITIPLARIGIVFVQMVLLATLQDITRFNYRNKQLHLSNLNVGLLGITIFHYITQ